MKPLRGFNKGACGTKLLPMTVLAYAVDCVCFCHLLDTQHCCLCPNGQYNPPPASHPVHGTRDITAVGALKIWHSVSWVAGLVIRLIYTSTVNLAWLQSSIRALQWLEYFNLVFLEISSVHMERFLQIQSHMLRGDNTCIKVASKCFFLKIKLLGTHVIALCST